MDIKLNVENLKGFVSEAEVEGLLPAIKKAHDALNNKTGKGAEFTGWMTLPKETTPKLLNELTELGAAVRKNSDCLISIGIGGSYIGIRSSLEFLVREQKIPVHYAGHNLSAGYLTYLLKELKNKKVSVVVISKSGTTTEPALAFRIVKEFMQKKYSAKELKKRIVCVTDEKKGALRTIADKNGYKSYPIADDVGGRFSVLSPVGLVPLAIAGVDIKGLIKGAQKAQEDCNVLDLVTNIAYQYAAYRYLLYKKGKKIEVLSNFYQRLPMISEWWKQLYGESEGKDGKGIFPASLNLTADLHSMGQLLQAGERNMFETFLVMDDPGYSLKIPKDKEDLDKFNYVAGKDLEFVNKQAYKATAMAHYEGGVPNMTITIPKYKAEYLGQLYYFFEKAVAISGYLLEVNPFNQPGVEAYKSKMFTLLGKK